MAEIIAGAVLAGVCLLIWASVALARYRRRTADLRSTPMTGVGTPSSGTQSKRKTIQSNTNDGYGQPELPHIQAMLVGPSASGKTMQLTAMHHNMLVGSGGVRLKAADNATQVALGTMVTRIMDAQLPKVPDATDAANIYRWEFNIEARGPDASLRPLFHLTYLDYAGEHGEKLFETPRTDSDQQQLGHIRQQFQSAIENYDVLIGVLDGAKIVAAMLNRSTAPELEQEIWQTVRLLSVGNQKVTHLVITKWDEFHSRGISLANVVAHLDTHPAFRDLRSMWMGIPGRQLRLIPVSALGLQPYLSLGLSGGLRRLTTAPGTHSTRACRSPAGSPISSRRT